MSLIGKSKWTPLYRGIGDYRSSQQQIKRYITKMLNFRIFYWNTSFDFKVDFSLRIIDWRTIFKILEWSLQRVKQIKKKKNKKNMSLLLKSVNLCRDCKIIHATDTQNNTVKKR